jgi:hypothetical protein
LPGKKGNRDMDNKDMVNSPAHYADSCSMECIDAMVIAFGVDEVISHCKITAFKYLWRHKHKGGEEDVRKASWYLDKAKDLMRGEVWVDAQIAEMNRQAQAEVDKYGRE